MMNCLVNNDVDVSFDEKQVFVSSSKLRYPNVVDLRDFCLPTNNQGNTPHCVGYTVAAYFEVENWKRSHVPVQFNADLIYQYGRKFKPDTISGTKIEYCLSGLFQNNVFLGDVNLFTGNSDCLCTSDIVKGYIHHYGCFMSAFMITDEWYRLSWSDVIKTSKNPKTLGGHCVLCCGYCKKGIYIQNSWGYESWGNYGFAVVPWELVERQFCYGVVIDNFKLTENRQEIMLNGFTSTSRGN